MPWQTIAYFRFVLSGNINPSLVFGYRSEAKNRDPSQIIFILCLPFVDNI
jgi:hypothetical protein